MHLRFGSDRKNLMHLLVRGCVDIKCAVSTRAEKSIDFYVIAISITSFLLIEFYLILESVSIVKFFLQ